MEATRQALLQRLKTPGAEYAWEDFFQVYWLPIVRYGQKLGLQEADAQDVLQETMIEMIRKLPAFQYDPAKGKFRNFLLTIVHRKVRLAQRRMAARGEKSFEAADGESDRPLADKLTAQDREVVNEQEVLWQQGLLERALVQMRQDPAIEPRSFAVFQDYAILGRPADEVARRHGLKANAVYQIKNRLIIRLRKQMAALQDGHVEPPEAL